MPLKSNKPTKNRKNQEASATANKRAYNAEIEKLFADLARRQKPLGVEFSAVLNDNIDELYES